MAIESRRLNLFFPQLSTNRELVNSMETTGGLCNTQMGNGVFPSTAVTVPIPLYGAVNNVGTESLTSQIMKPAIKSVDSSFTFNTNSNGRFDLPQPSRKRSRDSVNGNGLVDYSVLQQRKPCAPFSFLGQDISFQIQQQQLEIDQLIALHMGRVKLEIEEKRERQVRMLMEALQQGLIKKLRAKEEERENMGKLNHALEERVKTLCIENQIWRDLAQTNEATVHALRTNLEQVLAQVNEMRIPGAGLNEVTDDAASFCGSNTVDEDAGKGKGKGKGEGTSGMRKERGESTSKRCRNCGEMESCVLLLPCRHLCLCALCGSNTNTCPVCKSPKNASVNVNMSL